MEELNSLVEDLKVEIAAEERRGNNRANVFRAANNVISKINNMVQPNYIDEDLLIEMQWVMRRIRGQFEPGVTPDREFVQLMADKLMVYTGVAVRHGAYYIPMTQTNMNYPTVRSSTVKEFRREELEQVKKQLSKNGTVQVSDEYAREFIALQTSQGLSLGPEGASDEDNDMSGGKMDVDVEDKKEDGVEDQDDGRSQTYDEDEIDKPFDPSSKDRLLPLAGHPIDYGILEGSDMTELAEILQELSNQ